jgi:hypothetical protein
MIKEYCDICGKGLTDTLEDLFCSRKFIMQHANDPTQDRTFELSLCNRCKETMYYFMENPVLLEKRVNEMSLANRLRFLFEREIKL